VLSDGGYGGYLIIAEYEGEQAVQIVRVLQSGDEVVAEIDGLEVVLHGRGSTMVA
jgi:hypothetical protein